VVLKVEVVEEGDFELEVENLLELEEVEDFKVILVVLEAAEDFKVEEAEDFEVVLVCLEVEVDLELTGATDAATVLGLTVEVVAEEVPEGFV